MRSILAVAILGVVATLAGCEAPAHHTRHSSTSDVHVRQVRNSDDNSLLFWYILYSNATSGSCPCYTASSPTRTSDISSLSFTRTATLPAAAGNTDKTKVESEEIEQEPNEALPEEAQQELAQEEAAEAASEEADNSESSSDTSSDSGYDTSSDSSGGGDSGGGDSGGGGGE